MDPRGFWVAPRGTALRTWAVMKPSPLAHTAALREDVGLAFSLRLTLRPGFGEDIYSEITSVLSDWPGN